MTSTTARCTLLRCLCLAAAAAQAAALLGCNTWDLSFDVVAGSGSPADAGFTVTITNGVAIAPLTIVPPLPIGNNYHITLPALDLTLTDPFLTTMTNVKLTGCVNYTTNGVPVAIGIGVSGVPLVQVTTLVALELPCEQPAAPAPDDALFSADAAGILLNFTGPTDAANSTGYFPCEDVIDNADTTLQPNAQCIFLTPSQLWMQVTSSVVARPGTTLTIKPGIIGLLKALLCPFDTLNYVTGSVVVGVVSNALSPLIDLAGPQRIEPCADLVVQAVPLAARILEYSWTLSASQPVSPQVDSILSSSTSTLRIPAEYLTAGSYQVGLQVKDIFDVQSSVVTLNVERLASPVFETRILGRRTRTVSKSGMIDVFAEVTFPLCLTSSYSKIKMTWLRETSTNVFQPVTSLSDMPRRLLLPASGFPTGVPQHFRIQSESIDEPTLNNIADVWVTVEPSQLVARIAGGDRTVSKDGVLSFRSGSYDPDAPTAALAHSWECRTVPANTLCGTFSAASSSPWVFEPSTVSSTPLPPGRYTIKLSVTATDSRVATTQVQLIVVALDTFDIEILVNSTAFNTYGVVNRDEGLRLAASMVLPTADSITNASWTSTSEKEHPFPYKSSSVNCPFLVVDPVHLLPRRSYTFQFAAVTVSGKQGLASITVPVNAPPSPGRCTVEPSTGVAADTPFTLLCTDWVDEQLPLRYEFEVEGEIGTVPLVRKSENSMIQVVLPPLSDTPDCSPVQTATVRFRVFDALDASTTVTQTVTLTSACSTSSNAFFATTVDVAAVYEDNSEKVLSNALFAAIAGEIQDDTLTTLDQLLDAQSRLDLDDSSLLMQEALLATYLLANESSRANASSGVLTILQDVIASSSVCTTEQQLELAALTVESLAAVMEVDDVHDEAIMASLADMSRLHAQQYLVPGAPAIIVASKGLRLETVEYDSCALASLPEDQNASITFTTDAQNEVHVPTTLLTDLLASHSCMEKFGADSTGVTAVASAFIHLPNGTYQGRRSAIGTALSLSFSACGSELTVQDLPPGQSITLDLADPAVSDWLFLDELAPDLPNEINMTEIPEYLQAPTLIHVCSSSEPEVVECGMTVPQQEIVSCEQIGQIIEYHCAVNFTMLVCEFYNETLGLWDTSGCAATALDVDQGAVRCECNHLTAFTAQGKDMYARSHQTVKHTPELTADDVARNPGVVSMLVAMFGFYMVGFATAARNDQKKKRTRAQALWRTEKIQRLVHRLIASDPFVDQKVTFHQRFPAVADKPLAPQCDDVEQHPGKSHTRLPSCYKFDHGDKPNCLRVLQAKARPQTFWQQWWAALRTNHRLLSLCVADKLFFMTQKQKLTLTFCQALTLLLLSTLVYDGNYKFNDWYAQLTNSSDNTSMLRAMADALWICSVTVVFALPLTVILYHLFVAAGQEQKARYQYETKLRDEGSYLISSGQAETLAELRCLVFEIETLFEIAEAEYHALLLASETADEKLAADEHKDKILDPLQQRLQTAAAVLQSAESQLEAKKASLISTRLYGKDLFSAWAEWLRARKEIKQVLKQEELKANIGSLTIPQKVEYWHDQLVLSRIPRYSCWRVMYSWFVLGRDGYVPRDVHRLILAVVTLFTMLYIVLASTYILVYGLSRGQDTIRRAVASFFVQFMLDVLIYTPLLIMLTDVIIPRFVNRKLRNEIREADVALARVDVEHLLRVGSVEELLYTNKPMNQSTSHLRESGNFAKRKGSDAVELVKIRAASNC